MGIGNYGALQVMQFVVLSIPMIVYDIFPMAALLGCIVGLSGMESTTNCITGLSAADS